jgi:hypothetical protein
MAEVSKGEMAWRLGSASKELAKKDHKKLEFTRGDRRGRVTPERC